MAMTLAQKLNLKESELLVLNAPEGYLPGLEGELPGVALTTTSAAPTGATLLFVNNLDEAARAGRRRPSRRRNRMACCGSPSRRVHRR